MFLKLPSMKKICFLFLFLSFTGFSQEHAWVYFTDKANVEEALNNPETILSAAAIQRKALHHTPIDERDVPVNEDYIARVKAQDGIEVKAKSKWLNCIHVIGNTKNILALENLEFVDSIEFAADALNQRAPLKRTKKYSKLEQATDYNYGATSTQVKMLNTNYLHQKDFTGDNMIIAILDAGFPNVKSLQVFDHLRNTGHLLGGYDFPNRSEDFDNPSLSDHGTLVLSTMGGEIQNKFVGTAPDASYYLFCTEIGESETPVEESYWVEAAERADSLGVDVINSSLSYSLFDNPEYNYSTSDMDGNTAFVSRGANIAMEKGMLVVVSAGNSAENDQFPTIGAPADANVLTVGAVDPARNYSYFSSIGPSEDNRVKPDVAAQGQNVAAVDEFDNLVSVSGTSFSSPILAGSAASFWQSIPSYTNEEIKNLIIAAASLYPEYNYKIGYGIPDFKKAFQGIFSENFGPLAFAPNPTADILQIRNINDEPFHFIIFDTLGQKLFEKEDDNYEINLSGFSRGIYIAMFEQNGIKKSSLIIKK